MIPYAGLPVKPMAANAPMQTPVSAQYQVSTGLPVMAPKVGGIDNSVPVQSPVQTTTPVQVPQTGLIGSEAALQAGYNDATGLISQGYTGAEKQLMQYGQGLDSRTLNVNTSLGSDAVNAINQGVSGFDPYMKSGTNAQKLYDDLTGVNGQQAQSAAQSAYQSSPALQYQIDQMQKATERSAAARGGLLSGRAGLELQRNAQGLVSQDYFKNLEAVGATAGRGLEAAAQVGNLRSNQAQMSTQLQGQGLQAQTQYEMQKEQTRADLAGKLANLAESRGLTLGGMRVGLSQEQAQGRTNAGMAMAQNATQAASGISWLLNQQGIGVSDMMTKDISSVTDMIYQSGMQDKIDMQNLAALIANINGNQATNVQQANQDIGAAKAAGQLGIGNAANNLITQGIASGVLKV